jgi:uridine kinase
MKVALLISGYLRSFKVNIPNLKTTILDKFENVDVYLHITKNEHLDDKYFNINNQIGDLKSIEAILKPKIVLYEENIKFFKNAKKNNLYNLWIKYYKLNELRKINEIGFTYDLVIKFRPDLHLITEDIFERTWKGGVVYLPQKSIVDKTKLERRSDKHICDILAWGDGQVMDRYLNIYNELEPVTKVSGYTPETVLWHHLDRSDIAYEKVDVDYNVVLSMCNVFAIAGDSGSGKTTLSNILENYFSNSFVLECDRYHKWERGDENWKTYTHLNPNANYISKMSEDLFDLKVGKDIHHVNYDHSTGRFTPIQKIESSQNLIVCGLHSLMGRNESVYDLKIFIDTDSRLKTLWKIKRDVFERGYMKDQVIQQIERRKEDYEKYILPQRELSDLVINFVPDRDIDPLDTDSEFNIILNFYIKKDFSLIDIMEFLSQKNIKYLVQVEDKGWNKITFSQYKNLEDPRFTQNNFYDYIMLFILFLGKKLD